MYSLSLIKTARKQSCLNTPYIGAVQLLFMPLLQCLICNAFIFIAAINIKVEAQSGMVSCMKLRHNYMGQFPRK